MDETAEEELGVRNKFVAMGKMETEHSSDLGKMVQNREPFALMETREQEEEAGLGHGGILVAMVICLFSCENMKILV